MNIVLAVICSGSLWGTNCATQAGVTSHLDDFEGWKSAAGPYGTCDFVGFPLATPITGQYVDLGATFTAFQGVDFTSPFDPVTFGQDGWGLNGGGGSEVIFDLPQLAVGVHSPGMFRFELYRANGQLMFESGWVTPQPNRFAGFTSTEEFTKVRVLVPTGGHVALDNFYFSTVPAPSALGLFAISALARRRR